MDKKYEITDTTMKFRGRLLHRIVATRIIAHSFRSIFPGTLGGWVEHENNLSQSGSCFIADDAKVFDNASVINDAFISDSAFASGNSCIKSSAVVTDFAKIYDRADIGTDALICGFAEVGGAASVERVTIFSKRSPAVLTIGENALIKDYKDYLSLDFKTDYSFPAEIGFYRTRDNTIWGNFFEHFFSLRDWYKQYKKILEKPFLLYDEKCVRFKAALDYAKLYFDA